MIAIVLVGGNPPPPVLTQLNGENLLYWQTRWLHSQGFNHIVFATDATADNITSAVNQLSCQFPSLCLDLVTEARPLGTAGAAARCARRFPSSHVCIINGDTLFLSPLNHQYEKLQKSSTLDGILFATQVTNAGRFGVLETDVSHRLIEFREKQLGFNPVNVGVYLLKAELLEPILSDKETSFEYDCFPLWLNQGKQFEVCVDGKAPFIEVNSSNPLHASELLNEHYSLIMNSSVIA